MTLSHKQIGQARPTNTTPLSVYTLATGTQAIITALYVTNTSAAPATFRVFHDDGGTTYDETTALFWDAVVEPGGYFSSDMKLCADNEGGNVAVRTDTANALTFTLYGMEITA